MFLFNTKYNCNAAEQTFVVKYLIACYVPKFFISGIAFGGELIIPNWQEIR